MTKSSRKFTIIGGLYLFLLMFLLLTQPRSGRPAEVADVLRYYLFYLILWAFIALIIFVAVKNADKNWCITLFGKKTLVWAIIVLAIVGFILNYDFQRQFGCLVFYETTYSPTKFIIIFFSFILLSTGYYYSDRKIGKTLLIIEFIFWTFKALHYNSSLDLLFPGYFTMICWSLRFALIFKILNNTATDTKTLGKRTNG